MQTITPANEEVTLGQVLEDVRAALRTVHLTSAHAFRPLYPNVLVYICEREQMANGLWLPEKNQNKPMHEGIVLATWQSYTETKRIWNEEEQRYRNETIEYSSAVKPGDHVLFPHHTGLINGSIIQNDRFRVISEVGENNSNPGILAIVEHIPLDILEQLTKIIDSELHESPLTAHGVAEAIHKRYLLVDRRRSSVTISGK